MLFLSAILVPLKGLKFVFHLFVDNDNAVRAARFDNDEEEHCLFESAQTVNAEKAPPSSIEEVAARLFDEQLNSDDAPMKTINEMLSDHFKRLSEVTANSAYGAVAQTIDEYSTVVGQSIECGTDVSSQHADRPEFWIHAADLIDDAIRHCR